MKYTYLKTWAQEHEKQDCTVEKALYTNNELVLYFINGLALRFVHPEGDFFPILEKAESPRKLSGIWPQIEQMRWLRSRIAEDDRIIYFDFEYVDIYQQLKRLCLVAECILPQPNLILTNVKDNQLIILDAINKYSLADNPQRQILPNLPYFSPLTSYRPVPEEVIFPLKISIPNQAEDISVNSVNDYFISYYNNVLLPRKDRALRTNLLQKWKRELTKQKKKLAKQEAELIDAEKAETWHVMAETIKHNLKQINPGDVSITAINYFSDDLSSITIPLSVDKSPLDNMRVYIKKYQKAKKGYLIILSNIEKTKTDLAFVAEVLQRIESGEVIDSLLDPKVSTGQLKQKLSKLDKLLKLKIDENWEIVIGRKATENDLVTTQLGRAHDWWFHTRIYHGSHILLRNFNKKEPPPELIETCCSLAAWYSKARFSANVPVDYTQIRFVRKPRKSAPGFVTYTKHNTVFATPKDIRALKAEHIL